MVRSYIRRSKRGRRHRVRSHKRRKKVKTLPVMVGTKKAMKEDIEWVRRRFPNTKFMLKKIDYPKGWYQVRVNRQSYKKVRRVIG